ncbi:peptide chain release factor N(5)-glutamine methyltransferase [Galenea microaerophila]
MKSPSQTLTLTEALKYGEQHLVQAGLQDSPRLDSELLLSQVLQQPRSYLYTWPETTLTAFQQQQFAELLQQRAQGYPIAYLLGEKEFWGLPLKVTTDTLIPRPETELLVETAVALILKVTTHSNPLKPLNLLDLGTGSGAIALALSHELKSQSIAAQIIATDFSPTALEIAQLNAKRLQLTVTFLHGSWFAPLSAIENSKFDLICSNPPYIDPENEHLRQGDVRFEPKTALMAEQHGLADLAHIIQQAPHYLTTQNGLGWLLVEHGYDQQEAVQTLFQQAGFQQIQTLKDFAHHPRITLGKIDEPAN